MLLFSRWKTFFILALVGLGLFMAAPNAMNAETRAKMPTFAQDTINLGLDLQGGAHMLLEVDLSSVLSQALANERIGILEALRDNTIRPQTVQIRDGVVLGQLRDPADLQKALEVLQGMSAPVDPTRPGSGRTTEVEAVGDRGFRVTVTDEQIEFIRKRTIDQSIEVLRDRIDPSGTTEMTLVREGDDRILLQVPGAKNIDEIKSAINKTANLTFNLVHQDSENELILSQAMQSFDPETGRSRTPTIGTTYYPYEAGQGGGGLIVEERTRITGECLENASPGVHPERGDPIVNFSFNFRCAGYFGEMTAKNRGRRFAVVLDNQIVTAPNIRSAITGGRGFIEGSFTAESSAELSRFLNAGALPAKLLIVEERTVSAELGEASIRAGQVASVIGLIGVAIFMFVSYGVRFGTIAILALATNIALIAAALTILGATLTLPGIAGIILTIGMAVDANVLIFERIREETYNGRPPVNAIETGYRRSLAPILDANITTMIAAITLYFVGSGPVRGFAVTLAIGIVTSVFTAVVFARLLTATWLRGTRPKTLPI